MSAPRWWIAAQGRAWGPYPAARMAAFREEGRLGPDSLVSRDGDGPFTPAAETPELATLFSAPGPEARPAREPSPAAAASRTLLIVSDAPVTELAGLEAAIHEQGEVVRVRLGLWLLRTGDDASSLRNALSRRLGGSAMLLVVEAPLSAAAWFNLDGGSDRALRRLWAG